MSRTLKASASGAGIVAVVYVVAGWLLGWTDLDALVWTGASAAVAAVVVLIVWVLNSAACTAAAKAIEAAEAKRVRASASLVEDHRKQFRGRFEHALFGSLADWRGSVRRFVETLREELEAFRDQYRTYSLEEPEVGLPEGTATTEYVTPEEGVEGLLARRSNAIALRLKEFAAGSPPSTLFIRFRNEGGACFAEYEDAVRDAVLPALEDVREMTLDDFIEEAFPEREERDRVVYRAYRKSAPYALISDIGAAFEGGNTGGAQVESIAYASIWSPQSPGPLKAALAEFEASARYEKGAHETAADLMRIDLGYAAFQVAPFVEAEHDLRSWDEGWERFHTTDELARESRPIIPSQLELGDESDLRRRTACLGLAFGLVRESDREIEIDGETYPTYEAFVKRLRHYSGGAQMREIQTQLDEHQRKASREELCARLDEFQIRPDMDAVDVRIIKSERDKHSLF